MTDVNLYKMTKSIARQYYREFQMDPMLFSDPSECVPYVYSDDRADAYFDKQIRLGREYFAVIVGFVPVGEIILKNLEHPSAKRLCKRQRLWYCGGDSCIGVCVL